MEGLKIIAVSGSLRTASSNTAMLRAACKLAPLNMRVMLSTAPANLPLFNPDLESGLDTATPACGVVNEWNDAVREADGLLIACPEYARGVPGAFKNALDWLVGTDAFINKPFALFNASPRAHHAQDALRVTLETMSGVLARRACVAIPLLNRRLDADAIAADHALAESIKDALTAFAVFIGEHRLGLSE